MRTPALLFLTAALSLPAAALDLQAHRGGRGLAPENTLVAFERALEIGVTTLELDVGITADGVLVVGHDPSLNPFIVRDAAGQWLAAKGPSIRSLTHAQLKTYDVGRIKPETPYASQFASQQPRDGTRMPTLAEVFALVKERGAASVKFNIETKLSPLAPDETANPEVFANSLVNAIREAGMGGRVTVQSFDWRTLQIVQGLDSTIPTAYLTIQTMNSDNVNQGGWTAGLKLADHGSVPRMVKAAGGAVWSPNGGALKADDVKEAQALGLKVLPWTINAEADMERLIGWGVDGIITDYPDRLRAVMQKRGLPLPAPVAAPQRPRQVN
ncbi:MAG: glycerophosphodiester phosphodiesterase [Burkholderiaceae bacterium]